jgi:ankyrin repeat protein
MREQADRLPALLAEGADVDAAQADGTRPLHWAAFQSDVASARLLLEAGADPELRTATGMTPLLLAAENGNAESVEALTRAAETAFRQPHTRR